MAEKSRSGRVGWAGLIERHGCVRTGGLSRAHGQETYGVVSVRGQSHGQERLLQAVAKVVGHVESGQLLSPVRA